jgi:hypothetical protein
MAPPPVQSHCRRGIVGENTGRLLARGSRVTRFLSIALACGIGMLVPSVSHTAVTPTPVTTCITITHSGLYVVQNPLSTLAGDCLVIAASGVRLDLNGQNVTGGGTGIGIHVKKSATGVFIEGGNTGSPIISGFAVGLRNDAHGTGGENFSVNNNHGDGLLINGALGSTFFPNDCDNNGGSGVHIVGGGFNLVANSNALHNAQYGLWIERSRGNNIVGFNAGKNVVGVYFGCNTAFTGTGTQCGSNPASDANFVYQHGVGANQYGIVIDLSATNNVVTHNIVRGNIQFDALDENTTCDTNTWFSNTLVTKNQTCIQ